MSAEFRSSDLAGVHVALFTPLLSDCPRNLRNSLDLKKAAKMIEDDKLTPERKLPGPNGAYLIPLAEVERVLAERAA